MKEWNVPLGATEDRPAVDGTRDHRLLGGPTMFHRSLQQTEGGPQWTFYEGPHRQRDAGSAPRRGPAFKDPSPLPHHEGLSRPRKARWDCHGLPVELAVERELGFNGKPDIEASASLNSTKMPRIGAQARRRLLRDDLADGLLGRHGPGLLDHEPGIHRQRLVVVEDHLRRRAAGTGPPRFAILRPGAEPPQRPRVGPGYETVVDPSVFVACPVVGGDLAERFPACNFSCGRPPRGRWSRTPPWPLHPRPCKCGGLRTGEATFVVAEDLLAATLGDDAEVLNASRTGSGRRALPKAIRTGGHPRRPLRDPGRFRHHQRRLGHRTPGPGIRR